MNRCIITTAALLVIPAFAATQPWVARSNENAIEFLRGIARFTPEGVASFGLDGFDDQTLDLKPKVYERTRAYITESLKTLQTRLAQENDPLVKQDLEILVDAVQKNLHAAEVHRNYQLSYFDLPQTVYSGIRGLLDDQVAAARRPAALVRLKKYAGTIDGYEPITKVAEDRIRERLAVPGLTGPPRAEVEKGLSNAAFFVDGIAKLFDNTKSTATRNPTRV